MGTKAETESEMARILAIDYGRKRCGVAVTDPLRIIATALATVPAAELWDYLKDYFAKEDVDCVVVGEPRQMDNTPSESERFITPFVNRFRKAYPDMPLVGLSVLPDAEHILHTHIDFTARIIGEVLIDKPLMQSQLPPVAGDFQHITKVTDIVFPDFGCFCFQVDCAAIAISFQ